MKVDHATVSQEKYENLHVLNRVHITMRAFQGVTIKTKECFETLTWIWFCLSNAREFTGITRKFSILGLKAPPLWTKSRKGLRNLVLWVWICSLHFSPPVFKWLLFKNIHNTLIFRVVRMISTAHFIKNSISSLKGLFFVLKKKIWRTRYHTCEKPTASPPYNGATDTF